MARKAWCAGGGDEGVWAPGQVAAAARAGGREAEPCASLEAAVTKACAEIKNEPPRILVSGSLYLAGEVLAENG